MNEPMPASFALTGQRVLVVGGTRGIGRAIALEFARAGAEVIVNFVRERGPAEQLCELARQEGSRIEAIRADVSSDTARAELLSAVFARFADLSTLVFAAATGVHKPFGALTGRHFDFTYALNVKAFLGLVQGVAPRMPPGGSIIALSSEGAEHAMHHYGLVGSSKAALESLCRHLAVELGPQGLRVNVLSPGTVLTEAWKSMPDAESRLAAAAARAATGRLVTPEEVAASARFLASRAASGVSGHVLVVDGGARIRGAG